MDCGKLACSWIFVFVVLPKSTYYNIENFYFVEYLLNGLPLPTKSTKISIPKTIMNSQYLASDDFIIQVIYISKLHVDMIMTMRYSNVNDGPKMVYETFTTYLIKTQ